MHCRSRRYIILLALGAVILAAFIVGGFIANKSSYMPVSSFFSLLIVSSSVFIVMKNFTVLRTFDWILALILGVGISLGLCFATLFSPFPIFSPNETRFMQAIIRGSFTFVATLCGILIMRMGGPVSLRFVWGDWKSSIKSLVVGMLIGLPFSILNVYLLRHTSGTHVTFENPLVAAIDALQPAVVEEIVFRFAALGIIWLMLRNSFPATQAASIAAFFALLVHNFSHFTELFMDAPWLALGMGTATALIWGLPLTILALRRDLESAIAFHWVQDLFRFIAGF